MARHRNIRQLELDDISTYDEAIASSVDDDYGISPNTAAMYMYDGTKRTNQCLSFFTQQKTTNLEFSADDFPTNETEDMSPGLVSGRIKSNGLASEEKHEIGDDHYMSEMDLSDLMMGVPDELTNDESCCATTSEKHIPPSKNFTEIDFDSFEMLTNPSSGFNPMKPSSIPKSSTTMSKNNRQSKNLMVSHLNSSRLLTNQIFHQLPNVVPTIQTVKMRRYKHDSYSDGSVTGFVPPSSLGYSLSKISHDRNDTCDFGSFRCIETLCSSMFVRSRTASLYSLLLNAREVKPFTFDIPEPITFERRSTHVTVKQTKFTLPAPRQRKQQLVVQPKSTPSKTVQQKSGVRDVSPAPYCTPSVAQVGTSNLASCFSQKLELSQPKERFASPRMPVTPITAAVSSPSKPINRKPLLDEYLDRRAKSTEKELLNLIVVGHVDAGKSTLMGNLLVQLGHVSGKQLSKYRWEAQKIGKASFAYAWVLDQTTEERTRGVTMDIAQTSFETKSKRVVLMDAPGHKDFVPRVIGGASQADVALLVVNATNGEFETGFGVGGQTREHARLVRLLGCARLIIAVNKMDTVGWSETRFQEIQSQLTGFLKPLGLAQGAVFCPVSGLTGVNLLHPSCSTMTTKDTDQAGVEKLAQWYSGPCLVDVVDSLSVPDRTIDGPFRFVVSDIFKPAGLGVPAVAGRVISGAVSAGLGLGTSRVVCQPSCLPAIVKSIRSLCNTRAASESAEGDYSGGSGGLLDQSVKYAFAGDQVALILNGLDPFQSLAVGDLITDPDNPVPSASRIEAKILVFSVPQPITVGYPVIFYYHCTSVAANVTKLKSMTHKENKVEKTVRKPRCLLGNCTADVEITLDRAICLELYEKCKPLGRFMLRVGGESIAGGTVVSVLPPKKSRLNDQ